MMNYHLSAVCTQEAELLRPNSKAAAERDPPAQPLHRPRDSRARRHAPLRRQEPRLSGTEETEIQGAICSWTWVWLL